MNVGKNLAITAIAVTLAALSATAQAERVKWKMHSAWGSSVPHLGTSAWRFAENIGRMSGGDFAIKAYEPGALIPANEGFDATSKGSLEMAWTTAGYDIGKYPALAFFTAVPFGPSIVAFHLKKSWVRSQKMPSHPSNSWYPNSSNSFNSTLSCSTTSDCNCTACTTDKAKNIPMALMIMELLTFIV